MDKKTGSLSNRTDGSIMVRITKKIFSCDTDFFVILF